MKRTAQFMLAGLLLPLATTLVAQGAKVEFDRTGYRLVSLGEKKAVSARVVDARRKPVPNRPIAYRTADPSVAIVTPQGVVQSRRVGRTRVWAVSGSDSTSALIVVEQWAAKFAFSPTPVQFDAIGAQVTLDVQLRDAAGNAIPGAARRTAQCRPRDGDRVVQLDASGKVQSKSNGVTWIKCTDRGISDSVRVEVRQRPAKVMIVGKLQIGALTIPDTLRLRMRALDPKGDSIPGARATWASLNPNLVQVEPVSGFVRAVGPGTARIVTQVADATDTLTLTITGTPLAGTEATSAAAEAPTARTPTLQLSLDPAYAAVGDTARVVIRATDALGQPIPSPELNTKIRSTADSVARHLGKQRIVFGSAGSAYIVAQLAIGGNTVEDSIPVAPRARATADKGAGAPGKSGQVAFVRPEPDTVGLRARNARQIKDLMKAIVDSGIGKTTSGRTLSFEGLAAQAKHATKLSSTSSESRSGLLYGASATGSPLRWLSLSGTYRTGTLSAKAGGGEDMSVTELNGQVFIWPVSYIGIGGGYMIRGESTALAVARWTAANVTAKFRGSYIGDFVSPSVAISFFPVSSFSGDSAAPLISSLAGEAGLDFRLGYVTIGFRYYVENFTFPVRTGTTDQRSDQFSALRIRVGAMFGR